MNKAEIASYLVSLHTLMDAQFANPVADVSQTLAAEYAKHWGLLKDIIIEERDNEARQSERGREGGSENRTRVERYQPQLSFPDRDRSGSST